MRTLFTDKYKSLSPRNIPIEERTLPLSDETFSTWPTVQGFTYYDLTNTDSPTLNANVRYLQESESAGDADYVVTPAFSTNTIYDFISSYLRYSHQLLSKVGYQVNFLGSSFELDLPEIHSIVPVGSDVRDVPGSALVPSVDDVDENDAVNEGPTYTRIEPFPMPELVLPDGSTLLIADLDQQVTVINTSAYPFITERPGFPTFLDLYSLSGTSRSDVDYGEVIRFGWMGAYDQDKLSLGTVTRLRRGMSYVPRDSKFLVGPPPDQVGKFPINDRTLAAYIVDVLYTIASQMSRRASFHPTAIMYCYVECFKLLDMTVSDQRVTMKADYTKASLSYHHCINPLINMLKNADWTAIWYNYYQLQANNEEETLVRLWVKLIFIRGGSASLKQKFVPVHVLTPVALRTFVN